MDERLLELMHMENFDQVRDYLERNSEFTNGVYNVPIPDDEMEAMRLRITELSTKAKELKTGLKEHVSFIKKQIKPLDEEVSELLDLHESGTKPETGKIYSLVDHANNLVYYISERMELLSKRPANQSDMQLKIGI